MEIDEKSLAGLRDSVRDVMSEKRYSHTLGVEREAEKLASLFAPDKMMKMRAAALLHDITKEYNLKKQLKICSEFGIIIGTYDEKMPKTFHAKTAAALIPSEYPLFDDPDIINAVRYHTTGCENMDICEIILYLADYIEDTRTFDDCVLLRDYFWDAHPEKMENGERLYHLEDTLCRSFDMTMKNLIDEGTPIDNDTVAARNHFTLKRMTRNDENRNTLSTTDGADK